MNAIDILAKSHLEAITGKGLIDAEVPLLGKIKIRPVVNTEKSIEIQNCRISGDTFSGIFLTLLHHCETPEGNPLFRKADKLRIQKETNFETIASIYNAVEKVISENDIDIKKL